MRIPSIKNTKMSRLRLIGKLFSGAFLVLLLSLLMSGSSNGMVARHSDAETVQQKKPPKPDSDIFSTKELLSVKEVANLANRKKPFSKMMKSIPGILRFGKLQGHEKDIQEWVRYRVYEMTLKKHREKVLIHSDRRKLMDAINKTAFRTSDAGEEMEIRSFLCREVVKRCEDLLDNHIAVRLQAVTVISQLNILESKSRVRKNGIAYAPAALALVKILQDPKQHTGVKMVAVQGVTRISRAGSINFGMSVNISRKIGNAVLSELQKKETHYKYQMRLAESLGALRISLDQQNQPIFVDQLCRVMIDEKRHPEVRGAAAEALGVAQFASVISNNPQKQHLIAHEILKTTHDLAGKYNTAVKTGLGKTNWKSCFLGLYFSFEGSPYLRKYLGTVGLSSKFRNNTKIQGAFAAIKPVVKHMVEKGGAFNNNPAEPIPKPLIDALAKWINDNPPSTDRLSPGLSPLRNVTTSAKVPKDQK